MFIFQDWKSPMARILNVKAAVNRKSPGQLSEATGWGWGGSEGGGRKGASHIDVQGLGNYIRCCPGLHTPSFSAVLGSSFMLLV